VSGFLTDDGEARVSWPKGAPAPYGYLVARSGPPEARGLIADIVLDGAGLYVATLTPLLAIRVRLARAAVPDLPVVPMGITLAHGPIDGSLWQALVSRALAAMPDEVLLAVIARKPGDGEILVASAGPYALVEPRLDEAGTGVWQPQQASGCSVRATPIPDAVVEIHSHHAMGAYFSPTDDRDETGRRVYGVLGRLNSAVPELAFRVATGCKPHALERVPFEQVFAGERGTFRDVHFDAPASPEALTTAGLRPARRIEWQRRYRLATRLVLVDMSEDLAAIRELLEARPLAMQEPAPLSGS
jgi:Prokaryotic homologs of the JAB domain